MVRLFLIVLGWPLTVLLLVTLHDWYLAEVREPPREVVYTRSVQFPSAHRAAVVALVRFERLAPGEQEALVAGLRGRILTLDAWLERLRGAHYRVLCLGEFHLPATRRFLATRLLPRYPADALLLETTAADLDAMARETAAGRPYVPLLNADIGAVLRAAHVGNAAVAVHGIEETLVQRRARLSRAAPEATRDRALARSFWAQFRPGARHVILFGALHCSDQPHWLYHYLREQSPPRDAVRMLNVQVLGEHQTGALEAFTWFLGRVGLLPDGDYVIADTRGLPPEIHQWFGVLAQDVLAPFAAVVVFRQPIVRAPPRTTAAR